MNILVQRLYLTAIYDKNIRQYKNTGWRSHYTNIHCLYILYIIKAIEKKISEMFHQVA